MSPRNIGDFDDVDSAAGVLACPASTPLDPTPRSLESSAAAGQRHSRSQAANMSRSRLCTEDEDSYNAVDFDQSSPLPDGTAQRQHLDIDTPRANNNVHKETDEAFRSHSSVESGPVALPQEQINLLNENANMHLLHRIEELENEKKLLMEQQQRKQHAWDQQKSLLKRINAALEVQVREQESRLHFLEEIEKVEPEKRDKLSPTHANGDESTDTADTTATTATNTSLDQSSFMLQDGSISGQTSTKGGGIIPSSAALATLQERIQRAEAELMKKEAREMALTEQLSEISMSARKAQRDAECAEEKAKLLQSYLDASLAQTPIPTNDLKLTIIESIEKLEKQQDRQEMEREHSERIQRRLFEEKEKMSARQRARLEKVRSLDRALSDSQQGLADSFNRGSRSSLNTEPDENTNNVSSDRPRTITMENAGHFPLGSMPKQPSEAGDSAQGSLERDGESVLMVECTKLQGISDALQQQCDDFAEEKHKLATLAEERLKQLTSLTSRLSQLERETEDLRELQTQCDTLEKRCSDLADAKSRLETLSQEQQVQLLLLQTRLSELEQGTEESQKLQAQCEELEQRCANLAVEKSKLEVLSQEQTEQLSKLQWRLSHAEEEAEESRELRARFTALEQQCSAIVDEKSAIEKLSLERLEQLSMVQGQLAALERQKEELIPREEFRALQSKFEGLEQRYADLEQDNLESERRIAYLEKAINSKAVELSEARSKAAEIEKALRSEVYVLLGERDSLTERLATTEKETEETSARMAKLATENDALRDESRKSTEAQKKKLSELITENSSLRQARDRKESELLSSQSLCVKQQERIESALAQFRELELHIADLEAEKMEIIQDGMRRVDWACAQLNELERQANMAAHELSEHVSSQTQFFNNVISHFQASKMAIESHLQQLEDDGALRHEIDCIAADPSESPAHELILPNKLDLIRDQIANEVWGKASAEDLEFFKNYLPNAPPELRSTTSAVLNLIIGFAEASQRSCVYGRFLVQKSGVYQEQVRLCMDKIEAAENNLSSVAAKAKVLSTREVDLQQRLDQQEKLLHDARMALSQHKEEFHRALATKTQQLMDARSLSKNLAEEVATLQTRLEEIEKRQRQTHEWKLVAEAGERRALALLDETSANLKKVVKSNMDLKKQLSALSQLGPEDLQPRELLPSTKSTSRLNSGLGRASSNDDTEMIGLTQELSRLQETKSFLERQTNDLRHTLAIVSNKLVESHERQLSAESRFSEMDKASQETIQTTRKHLKEATALNEELALKLEKVRGVCGTTDPVKLTKLLREREELKRMDDIRVSEIERLSKACNYFQTKASKFLHRNVEALRDDLSETLREANSQDLTEQLDQSKKELETVVAKVKDLEEQVWTLDQQLKESAGARKEMNSMYNVLKEELKLVESDKQKLATELIDVKSDLVKEQERLKEATALNEESTLELENVRGVCGTTDPVKLTKLLREREEWERVDDIRISEIERLSTACNYFQTKASKFLQRNVEALRDDLSETLREANSQDLTEQLDQSKKELETVVAKVKDLEEQVWTLDQKWKESASAREEMDSMYNVLKEELKLVESDKQNLATELIDVKSALAKEQERMRELKKLASWYESAIAKNKQGNQNENLSLEFTKLLRELEEWKRMDDIRVSEIERLSKACNYFQTKASKFLQRNVEAVREDLSETLREANFSRYESTEIAMGPPSHETEIMD